MNIKPYLLHIRIYADANGQRSMADDNEVNGMIKLGNFVRDVVTGFQGYATAKVEYINGCTQFCVTPTSEDGKMPEGVYLDYQRLQFLAEGPTMPSSDTGGTMRDTPPGNYRG